MASLDLSPGILDLSGIRAGDRNALRVTLTQGGTPLNLTGYDVTAQARVDPHATGAINGVVEDRDDPAGAFTLRWPGDEVRTLLGSKVSWTGVWDLQILLPPETDATTVIAGKWSAVADVTRPGAATFTITQHQSRLAEAVQ